MNKFFRATCLSILGAAAASAGIFACSSTDSTTADGGPGDGGGGGDGNPANGDGGGNGSTVVGNISVVQNTSLTNAIVSFGKTTTKASGSCTTSAMGSCNIVVCPAANADAGLPMQITTPNAGTVTLAGGTAGADTMITVPYGSIGDAGVMGYPSVRIMSEFYKPGDMITATGAGGADLPAFAAQTVPAPSDVTVTSPVCAMTMCPDVDRSMDMVVTWTGGGAGDVDVAVEMDSDTTTVGVSCTFPASSGTGTIPTAALMMLPVGADVGGLVSILPASSKTFSVGTVQTRFVVLGGGAQGLAGVAK